MFDLEYLVSLSNTHVEYHNSHHEIEIDETRVGKFELVDQDSSNYWTSELSKNTIEQIDSIVEISDLFLFAISAAFLLLLVTEEYLRQFTLLQFM